MLQTNDETDGSMDRGSKIQYWMTWSIMMILIGIGFEVIQFIISIQELGIKITDNKTEILKMHRDMMEAQVSAPTSAKPADDGDVKP